MPTPTSKLLLLLIIIPITPFLVVTNTWASVEEASALLNWKGSFENQNNAILTSWQIQNSSNPPKHSATSPCNWFGVSCFRGSVYSLNLTNSSINGTLLNFPFLSLKNLMYLDLSMNELYGSIPSEISNLSKLNYLDLSINQLSGSISPEIGLLRNLQTLYLYDNGLNGSIPVENSQLLSLKNLMYLDLCKNELYGSIPSEISNLSLLNYLDLSINQLSGSIPPEIGLLTNLKLLYLYDNGLNGSIPSEMGSLTNLLVIYLDQNMFIGPIPNSFGNLINLEVLHVSKNLLSGHLPKELGKLNKLVILEMFSNQFTGHLPEELFSNNNHQHFTVFNNSFSGPIPKSFKTCTSLVRARFNMNNLTGNLSEVFGVYPDLEFIDLSGNNFHGELSSNWIRCNNLQTLNLANNKLTGYIPPEFGNMTELGLLNLSSNHITGVIPKELGKLKYLLHLNLNDNQLSGAIPQELGSLSELLSLDLSINFLNGPIPESLGDCQKLFYLSLSHNHLDQSIPSHLGESTQLNRLDLSHNFLTGKIPSELSNLENLETLNLSRNNLSGSIPNELSKLSQGVCIDLSFNDLVGPIPNGKAFTNATFEQFAGNKGLMCGNITGFQPCENFEWHGNGKNKRQNITLIIVLPLVGALILLGAFTGIFFRYETRKITPEEKDLGAKGVDVFSISSFDGRALYVDILKATEEFNEAFCIGKGGYASVYKANLASAANTLAIKRLHNFSETRDRNGFLNEIRALTEIKHRNIVKLHAFCSSAKHSFLVYQYFENGSLAKVLSIDDEARDLGWPKRINIIRGVSHALCYMHQDCSPSIVHRDIKSHNVLLDSEYEAHVSDFGTAKFLHADSSNWSAVAGTYGYIPPEFVYSMKVTEKSDVYSFGVLTLEILKGRHPGDLIPDLMSPGHVNIELKELLDQRLPYPLPDDKEVLISILKVARECLNTDPKSRPTMPIVSNLLSKGRPLQKLLGA